MKKLIAFIFCFIATDALAVNWWERPTVCQPSNAACYPNMTDLGFDTVEWDTAANCRGMKLICPTAILTGASNPTPFSRAEIAAGLTDPDFDITVLDNRNACFGTRRTRNNGSSARIGNTWVNVWCAGVLDMPDEVLDTGEIIRTANDQPTCSDLAEYGFIGILNGRCFGTFGFPPSDFFLECLNTNNPLLPSRIIVLNGAHRDHITIDTGFGTASVSDWPITEEIAAARFSHMIDNAALTRHRNAAQALADAQNK